MEIHPWKKMENANHVTTACNQQQTSNRPIPTGSGKSFATRRGRPTSTTRISDQPDSVLLAIPHINIAILISPKLITDQYKFKERQSHFEILVVKLDLNIVRKKYILNCMKCSVLKDVLVWREFIVIFQHFTTVSVLVLQVKFLFLVYYTGTSLVA